MFSFRILHLSDLHFGKIHGDLPLQIRNFIHTQHESVAPLDLIIVTGDLTQRARSAQFLEAVQFLKSLGLPTLVISGNHDLPLYNILQRWFWPLRKYKNFVTEHFSDIYHHEKIRIVGLQTTNPYTIKSGRLLKTDMKKLKDEFSKFEGWKVLAIHHPPEEVFIGDQWQELISEVAPHIILSGHHHTAFAKNININPLVVHVSAGTATSSRTRGGEENSFNVLSLKDHHQLKIETLTLEEAKFAAPKIQNISFI